MTTQETTTRDRAAQSTDSSHESTEPSASDSSLELGDEQLDQANGGVLPIIATGVGAGMILAGVLTPSEPEVPMFDAATLKKLKGKSC